MSEATSTRARKLAPAGVTVEMRVCVTIDRGAKQT